MATKLALELTERAVTAATTAAAQEFIVADAATAAYAVTGPTAGSGVKRWGVKRIDSSSGATSTNAITVNFVNNAGAAASLTLTLNDESKIFRASGSGFRVENGDTPRSQTDLRYAPAGAEFFHDFSGLTAGQTLPAVSDSGHGLRYVYGSNSNGQPVAVAGGVSIVGGSGQLAGYICPTALRGPVRRLGMWASYSGGTDLGGANTLVVWQQDLAARKQANNQAIPAASIHAPISRKGGALQYWPTDGAAGATTLATPNYAYSVTDNTLVYIEVEIDDDKATVFLPDGSVKTVQDSHIRTNAGTWPCFEIFLLEGSTNAMPKIVKIWASSDPNATLRPNPMLALEKAVNRLRKASAIATAADGAFNAATSSPPVEFDTSIAIPTVVPASGKLLVEMSAFCNAASGVTLLWAAIITDRSGTVLRNGSVYVTTSADINYRERNKKIVVSGLTPDQDVIVRWGMWATGSGASITKNAGAGVLPALTVEPLA